MAKGKFLVNSTGQATLVVEGVTMNLHESGYPKGDAELGKAAGLADDYTVYAGAKDATDYNAANLAGELMIIPKSLTGSKSAVTCYLKYKTPVDKAAAPVYELVATPAGCE
jgi:hypothetical protein